MKEKRKRCCQLRLHFSFSVDFYKSYFFWLKWVNILEIYNFGKRVWLLYHSVVYSTFRLIVHSYNTDKNIQKKNVLIRTVNTSWKLLFYKVLMESEWSTVNAMLEPPIHSLLIPITILSIYWGFKTGSPGCWADALPSKMLPLQNIMCRAFRGTAKIILVQCCTKNFFVPKSVFVIFFLRYWENSHFTNTIILLSA